VWFAQLIFYFNPADFNHGWTLIDTDGDLEFPSLSTLRLSAPSPTGERKKPRDSSWGFPEHWGLTPFSIMEIVRLFVANQAGWPPDVCTRST
jgi:hypothetical protein